MSHEILSGNRAPSGRGAAKSAASRTGAAAPLGIVTKTSSTPSGTGSFDPETGEVLTPNHQTARANRFALKSVVNKLLPGSRTSKCMVLRAPVPGHGLAPIEVHKGHNCKRAFYHGLMACGSIWTCPVCAAKISERRRLELADALERAKSKGWACHFVTLTVPHGAGDDLREILTGLSAALKRMSSGMHSVKTQLRKLCPDSEIHGYIRALEVTHGENGFHPHFHMILFTSRDLGSSVLQHIYARSWQRACRLSGLPIPSDRHGCTVQDGSKAAKYASKWGIEDEMTKAHAKTTRRKGCTPWGLLRAVLDGNDADYSPERAAGLFRVYADAFKGRRQLYWSNGLRKRLDMGQEVADEVLAERPDDERAYLVGTLSVEDWRVVRRCRAESVVLDAAEAGPESMAAVLDQLQSVSVTNRLVSSPTTEPLPGAVPGPSVPATPTRPAAGTSPTLPELTLSDLDNIASDYRHITAKERNRPDFYRIKKE